jgi:hypothetical protein
VEFRLSEFNPTFDKKNRLLNVNWGDFEKNTLFYLNFVTYTLSSLLVTVSKKPKWVIEPEEIIKTNVLRQLNMGKCNNLGEVLLDGGLIELIGGNPRKLNQKIKSLQTELAQSKHREEEAQYEIRKLKGEIGRLEDRVRCLGNDLAHLREIHRSGI